MVKYIIFTDLDGTLLDHLSYSHHAASHALKLIKGKGIPLIICSSKTRAEILPIRRRLMNKDPFISENGGAFYIPDRYFRFSYPFQKKIKRYKVIEIGTPHKILLNVLREIKDETGVSIEGISEMSIQEIMDFTSLTKREAALAKKRGYSEPFLIYPAHNLLRRDSSQRVMCGVKDERSWINIVKREILKKGFKFSYGGRFFHIMKDNDKGKAVKILKKLYAQKYGNIKTIGIGNSLNDLPMLKAVDIPVLVKNYDGRYERGIRLKNLYLADGIGPEGWNNFIISNLKFEI
ncbi:MAG: HAD-IIB family hydrolase [Nitrospinae bacterium]|nr:HAD-IIB family hydrolase [Nitrospinota bacterium]